MSHWFEIDNPDYKSFLFYLKHHDKDQGEKERSSNSKHKGTKTSRA